MNANRTDINGRNLAHTIAEMAAIKREAARRGDAATEMAAAKALADNDPRGRHYAAFCRRIERAGY